MPTAPASPTLDCSIAPSIVLALIVTPCAPNVVAICANRSDVIPVSSLIIAITAVIFISAAATFTSWPAIIIAIGLVITTILPVSVR